MLGIYDIILYSEDEETGKQEFYSYQGDCSFMFDDITPEDCIEIDNPEQDDVTVRGVKRDISEWSKQDVDQLDSKDETE